MAAARNGLRGGTARRNLPRSVWVHNRCERPGATSIRAVPPDALLFEIPNHYEAVSPSEAVERLRAFRKAPPIAPNTLLLLQRADAYYRKNRVDISLLQ